MHHPRCRKKGCGQLAHARGLCNAHYLDWYCHGDREEVHKRTNLKAPSKCSVVGCKENTTARGFCMKHYRRVLRQGYAGLTLTGRARGRL